VSVLAMTVAVVVVVEIFRRRAARRAGRFADAGAPPDRSDMPTQSA